MLNTIVSVEKDGIGSELLLKPGDSLISINGNVIKDVFDYRFQIQNEYIELEIEKAEGGRYIFEIEKDEYEDLGITFASGLMDKAKSCRNKCIFCFIDQLPKDMRDTMYFKDDDSRLSFLQGNYVTLTNMEPGELDRIINFHLSPINISVHSTEPELRKTMLKNPTAGNILEYIQKLANANIELNFQIVLCKGINDGVHLDRTIEDLSGFIPNAASLSVVPVGLTKFRDRLYPLEPFNQKDCRALLHQIDLWQRRLKAELGTRFVFAADEFYLDAGEKIPAYKEYEGFPQLENGVGMLALMEREFSKALNKVKEVEPGGISIVTGKAAYHFINGLADRLHRKFPQRFIDVIQVGNTFFGENITVSGLLTGGDILKELREQNTEGTVLIPANALRANDDVFLDDLHISDLERELPVKIIPVKINGQGFIKALTQ